MIRLVALFCGVLCGTGMIVSGLFRPDLLQNAIRLDEVWDVAFGAGLLSAVTVSAIVFALTRRLSYPLLGEEIEPPPQGPKWKALLGGGLFGLGWGLAGYFPLAALVALGLMAPGAVIFLTSVLCGMVLFDLVANRGRARTDRPRSRG